MIKIIKMLNFASHSNVDRILKTFYWVCDIDNLFREVQKSQQKQTWKQCIKADMNVKIPRSKALQSQEVEVVWLKADASSQNTGLTIQWEANDNKYEVRI